MEELTNQLAGLDASAAVLFILVGLVYGLFGWRLVRILVVIDGFAVGAICAYYLMRMGVMPFTEIPAVPFAILSLMIFPFCAWRFPEKATIGMAACAGFAGVQLFLMDFELPDLALLALGLVGAGFAMSLAVTLARQTTVIITGLHGGWLCVGALAIIAFNQSGTIGQMLNSFSHSVSLVAPAAALAFSSILIFLQWGDMQGHTSQI